MIINIGKLAAICQRQLFKTKTNNNNNKTTNKYKIIIKGLLVFLSENQAIPVGSAGVQTFRNSDAGVYYLDSQCQHLSMWCMYITTTKLGKSIPKLWELVKYMYT